MPFGMQNCSKVELLRANHGWEPRLASDPPITLKERLRMPLALVDPHFASGYQVAEQTFVI